jgi:hypothetical protein
MLIQFELLHSGEPITCGELAVTGKGKATLKRAGKIHLEVNWPIYRDRYPGEVLAFHVKQLNGKTRLILDTVSVTVPGHPQE